MESTPLIHGSTPATVQKEAAQTSIPGPLRPVARQKSGRGGHCFLVVIILAIAIIYSIYLFVISLPDLFHAEHKIIPAVVLAIFHIAFLLFLVALFQVVNTDAGGVPSHWGFYVGDEARRRRYCRICNVWKPNRTHHCSHCNRCILNMDHHCPWINNCVGFYNRKFFIQTLFYANIILVIIFLHGLWHGAAAAKEYWPAPDYSNLYVDTSPIDYVDWALTVIIMAAVCVILAGLIPFTRFHWHLLVINSTTIESMDPMSSDQAVYDLGTTRNIEQVFGPTRLLWWIPQHLYSSRPVGDGVRWKRHYLRAGGEM